MNRLLATAALAALTAFPVVAQTPLSENRDLNAAMIEDGIEATRVLEASVHMPGVEADTDGVDWTSFTDAPDTWENVGEVEDILISADGNVDSIVLGVGGFLGMGEKSIEVSMQDLRVIPDADEAGHFFILYTGNRETLETAEPYDPEAAKQAGKVPYSADTPDTAEAEPADGEGAETEAVLAAETGADEGLAEADAGGETMASADGDATAETGTAASGEATEGKIVDLMAMSAEDLEGIEVYGPDEDWVGEIGQLLLGEDGQITHAVVDVGGFLGIGEKPIALPFDDIEFRQFSGGDEYRALVELTREQLEGMEVWSE